LYISDIFRIFAMFIQILFMSGLGTKIPNQKLTSGQKKSKFGSIEKWGEDTIKTILDSAHVSGSHSRYDTNYRMQVNYDLVAGIFNKKDLEYVEKPYGDNYSFPAKLTHYDLISPKINVLAGEETKRPFNFRVVSTSPDAISRLMEQKKEFILGKYMNEYLAGMQEKGTPQEGEQQEVPEDIEKYMKYSYKDIAEVSGQRALEYLYKKLKLKSLLSVGWRDLLTVGTEVFRVGMLNGNPYTRLVNPLYFDFDRSPNLRYIEDAAWAKELRYMSAPDVYDEFYEVLTEADVERIENIKSGSSLEISDSAINIPIVYQSNTAAKEGDLDSSDIHVRVEHVEWKSLRKIGILKYLDENKEVQEMVIDQDSYTVDGDYESVEWFWVNEVWEGDRIMKDIFVNIRPVPNQRKSISNPSECKLSYVGIAYNNRNSKAYSLVEIMKPHQYLYDILMYRLELEIARAKGKKMVMDIAQIPRSWGFDVEKWLYYFDAMGIAWVNSFEEGDGKFEGRTSAFNQFQAIDLSLANTITTYVNILDKIESMLDAVSGITPQREGAVHQSETVGGVERAITQSSHITEPLFATHAEVKNNLMQALLDTSKIAWSDGKTVSYIGDDLSRAYYQIDGDQFSTEEFDIFVTDGTKENRNIELLKSMVQPMIQNGAPMSAIADMLMKDSIAEIKQNLKTVEDEINQRAQAAQQAELEANKAEKAAGMELEMMKEQGQETRNIRDNETKIIIAGMGGDDESEYEPEDNSLEERKVVTQETKARDDTRIKEKALAQKAEETAQMFGLKKQEIAIKKKQASQKTAIAPK
jgi:hypothetical protein